MVSAPPKGLKYFADSEEPFAHGIILQSRRKLVQSPRVQASIVTCACRSSVAVHHVLDNSKLGAVPREAEHAFSEKIMYDGMIRNSSRFIFDE